jgi:hypothetical protein
MSGRRAPVYLDSSAIVKLVVSEAESTALRAHIEGRPLVSSAVAQVEVTRACMSVGEFTLRRVHEVLSRIDMIHVSAEILAAAAEIRPPGLRPLGPLAAIHLASLGLLAHDVRATCVTYDDDIADGARALGWSVARPD